MSRWIVGTVVLGWMLACTGTETTTPEPATDEVVTPAPADGEAGRGGGGGGGGGGKARKGGKSKAGGRPIEGEFTGIDMGDLMHLGVKTADGKEHDFICVDAACSD